MPLTLAAAHALYGANQRTSALTLVVVEAVALLAWLAASPPARQAIQDGAVLRWPAALSGLALAAAAWSLTPWAPGGVLPIWDWTQVKGAATLDRTATFVEILKLAGLGCIALVGFIQGVRPAAARATLRIVMVVSALYAFLAMARFLAGGEVVGQAGRMGAGFLSPNSAGTLFAALTVLSVSWVVQAVRRGGADGGPEAALAFFTRLAARLALVVLFSGCLFLTASRAAIATTGLMLVAYMIWEMAAGGLKVRAGAAVLTTWALHVAILLAGAGALALSRTAALGGDFAERGSIFALHWKMFLASPLTGWGLGSFDQINQQIMTPASHAVLWKLRAAHNIFLQWLEEAGLVGAAPMFLGIAAVMLLTLRGMGQRQEAKPWLRALILVDGVFIVHGLSDFALQVPSLAAFWAFLLGLQLAMANPRRRSQAAG
jgi:O-antigen ligase